jgi:hypothetical protein
MSSDMEWSLDYCLACDSQTDGGAYCGEACRLAEYEKANMSSESGSPLSQRSPMSWSPLRPGGNGNCFYLPPAYDFGGCKTQTDGCSPSSSRPQTSPISVSKLVLTPSSSQLSLVSLRSSASPSPDAAQLSEDARRELRAYASSFDQSRYQRRQSTH